MDGTLPARGRAVGVSDRLDPAQREVLVANGALLVLLLVGTLGYRLIEGWPWVDGFYMTFITLTTIGFGEVGELSVAGRFFTILIGVVGIGLVAFIAARSAQILLSTDTYRARVFRKRMTRMEDHYILCGYGRVGQHIAGELARDALPFVVVDCAQEAVDEARAEGVLAIHGDAEDERTLVDAGIARARGLVLTLPDDSANVFITLGARELRPELFILARTNDPRNRRKLEHAGASKVIAPDIIGADRMVQVILRPTVDAFMEEILNTGTLGLRLNEARIEPSSLLAGKTLAESRFRQAYDLIVVGVRRAGASEMRFNPPASLRLEAGDVLVVLGTEHRFALLQRDGCRAR